MHTHTTLKAKAKYTFCLSPMNSPCHKWLVEAFVSTRKPPASPPEIQGTPPHAASPAKSPPRCVLRSRRSAVGARVQGQSIQGEEGRLSVGLLLVLVLLLVLLVEGLVRFSRLRLFLLLLVLLLLALLALLGRVGGECSCPCWCCCCCWCRRRLLVVW